jgi:AraC-like DNA-binding protein
LSTAPFLAVGDVCERLGISRSTLQNIFPYLAHLSFSVSGQSERQTRLFPTTYINGYAAFLRQGSTAATIPSARAFGQTATAKQLIREAQQRLEATIASSDTHTPDQIAEMLGIGRATITGWERAGVFRVKRGKVRGGKVVPLGPRQRMLQGRQLIPASELRQAAKWVMPQQ